MAKHALKFYFSNKYCYAHLQNVVSGKVAVAASTFEKTVKESLQNTADKGAARKLGEVLLERAKGAGITEVKWEKPKGRPFHGKMAELVNAIREGGIALR